MNTTPYNDVARLPYYPEFKERFGVDAGRWKTLIDACYPSAKTVAAVVMALDYCRARNLDPFKKPINIVPMWSKTANNGRGGTIETVWPGISELRTTAHRTAQYAGIDKPEYGPDKVHKFDSKYQDEAGDWQTNTIEVTAPEWMAHTVHRIVQGVRCAFHGPRVYWIEAYATQGKSDVPNSMWQDRPRGQLEKVSEASALRVAFPEEIGGDYSAEEMEGRTMIGPGPSPPEMLTAPNLDSALRRIELHDKVIAQIAKDDIAPQQLMPSKPKKSPPVAVKSGVVVTAAGVVSAQAAPTPASDPASPTVPGLVNEYVEALQETKNVSELAGVRTEILEDDRLTDEDRTSLRQYFVEAKVRFGLPVKKTKTSPPDPKPSGTPGVTDGKITELQPFLDWAKEQMSSRAGNIDDLSSFWTERVEPIILVEKDNIAFKALEEMYEHYSSE